MQKPAYLDTLGLQTWPFADEGELDFFYQDPAREELLGQIAHLLEYTPLTLIVEGEKGIGKSALLRHLFRHPRNDWRCCLIDAATARGNDILHSISRAYDFEQRLAQAVDGSRAFVELLEAMRQSGLLAVVFVDNAEQLNEPDLEFFARLSQGVNPLIRILFTCEKLPDTLERVFHDHDEEIKRLLMISFDTVHSGFYLAERLRRAGMRASMFFSDDDLAYLHREAQGNPTQIHQVAEQHLEHMAVQMQQEREGGPKGVTAPSRRLQFIALGLSVAIVVMLAVFVSTPQTENRVVETLSLPDKNETPEEGRDEQPAIEEMPTAGPQEEASDSLVADKGSMALPLPAPQSLKERAEPAPVTAPAPTPAPSKAEQGGQTKDNGAEAKTVAPGKINFEKFARIEWIKQQNPAHYSLQLLGAGNEQAIVEFIKRHKLEAQAAYYHEQRKGKDWYSLLYGSYASRGAAKKGAAALPKGLIKGQPWIRQFRDIHKAL